MDTQFADETGGQHRFGGEAEKQAFEALVGQVEETGGADGFSCCLAGLWSVLEEPCLASTKRPLSTNFSICCSCRTIVPLRSNNFVIQIVHVPWQRLAHSNVRHADASLIHLAPVKHNWNLLSGSIWMLSSRYGSDNRLHPHTFVIGRFCIMFMATGIYRPARSCVSAGFHAGYHNHGMAGARVWVCNASLSQGI